MELVSAQHMLFLTQLSKLAQFKVIQGQWLWCQSEAHWWFPIWPPLCLTLYLSRYSWYFLRKFCDLDLEGFKVTRGQRSWCQSIAHGWFPIWLLLTPSSYHRIIVINFEIFDVQIWWPWTRIVQGHPRLVVMCQLEANWWFSIWPQLCPTLYLSRHSRYLMWKLCDLDLRRFKVIQGQRWWCQSTAYGWLPIRLPLTAVSNLSPFLKYWRVILMTLNY